MKRIPKMYNSVERSCELKMTTRADKLGNVFYCVEYTNYSSTPAFTDYVTFKHLSSALDFITSNFK